jgi:hypothetical protein
MDDGLVGWIWVGRDAPAMICEGVFGEQDPEAVEKVDEDTEGGKKLLEWLERPVRVCVDGGRGAAAFVARLIEKEGAGMPGLEGFLWRIQKAL